MLTQLDVLNQAIGTVGMAPVSSIDSNHPIFRMAKSKLNAVLTDVQAPGYWFNQVERTLSPGFNGRIVVPQNSLNVRVHDYPNIIVRGTRLYNKNEGTDVFDRPFRCTITEKLPIEELPGVAAAYVSARLKLEFYTDQDGTEPKLSQYTGQLNYAMGLFSAEDIRNRQQNGLEAPSFLRRKFPYTRVAKVR